MMRPSLAEPLLEVTHLRKSFGGIRAVNGCSFSVPPGAMLGLIGPNGAGKSVTFNVICGLLRPDSGEVRFKGERTTHLPCNEIARRGLGRTFQEVRVFPRLTAMENILLAQQEKGLLRNLRALVLPGRPPRGDGPSPDDPEEVLREVGLLSLKDERAGNLSYGQQKLLEFARVMTTRPDLVLLDEPVAGVNPTMVNRILEAIAGWNERGTAFVVVEHNMKVIMSICHHIVVLSQGQVIAEGTPQEVQRQEHVIEAYLGAAR